MSGDGDDRTEGPELVAWPRAAASAAIFRGSKVLIAERGAGPMRGSWSLPGGKIEPGETAAAAARREIKEETGLDVTLSGLIDLHEVIHTDPQRGLLVHYIIAVHYGTSLEGEPRAATDISDARFVGLGDLERYRMTDGAVRFIKEGYRRLGLVS